MLVSPPSIDMKVCVSMLLRLRYALIIMLRYYDLQYNLQDILFICSICVMYEWMNEMFYLTTHSTHLILRLYGVRHMVKNHSNSEKGNHCRHMDYFFRLTARVLLYAPSHRQDTTYHSLRYTSRGALAGTRNSIMSECSYHGATSCSMYHVMQPINYRLC